MTQAIKIPTRPFFKCKQATYVFAGGKFYSSQETKAISLDKAVKQVKNYMCRNDSLPLDIRCCVIKTIPKLKEALITSLKHELAQMAVTRSLRWNDCNKLVLENYLKDVIKHLTEEFPDND